MINQEPKITEHYYLKADHQTEWDEVTREQFINAEQAAGFRSKFGVGHLATSGFSGKGMRGKVEHVEQCADDCHFGDRDGSPASRAGERVEQNEWYTDSRRSADATIYARRGNRWIGQVHARFADQIVTEHNQHAALIEQRERLVKALRDLLECSRCQNGCAPDDMTCATNQADAVLATIEQETEVKSNTSGEAGR